MTEINAAPGFVEDLPIRSRRHKSQRLVSRDLEVELRENVGRWYLLDFSVPVGMSYGKPRYLGDEFEWTQHKNEDRINFYVRYIGGAA